MSDKTIYVKLYELHLTNEKNTYSGKVKLSGMATNRQIAERIVKERTEYRPETIISIANLIDNAKREFLREGFSISDGVCHMTPIVNGKFIGEDAKWNPKEHSLSAGISPATAVRKALSTVTVTTDGKAKTGPVINNVIDSFTSEHNVITPGRPLFIYGSHIRIAGEDGDGTGIVFINITENGDGTRVTLNLCDIIINNPSSLQILAPALEAGDWQIEIATRYCTGKTQLRKETRTYRFEQTLTII